MIAPSALRRRSRMTHACLGAALLVALQTGPAAANEKVVRIGMTAADIPKTHGQPDQAFEGNRTTGLTLYDALTAWDYVSGTRIVPALATDWTVDPTDRTKWTFRLRPGITFRDGSAFTAEAVVWNVRKVLDKAAPHFDASQVGFTVSRMPTLRSARALDAFTVEITTSEPDSFLPINLVNLFMASPAHWEAKLAAIPAEVTDPAQRSARAWQDFALDPSGTGPFRLAAFTPRQRLELVRNAAYWDTARVPKLDRLVFVPMPETNARSAALLSGQVDWIEAPAPDAIGQLKSRGFQVVTSAMVHVWPWQPSLLEGSPWRDKRVRQAANLCVDRADLVALNGGLAEPASGQMRPSHPWFGNPTFKLRFAPDEGRRLMAEAGYSAGKLAPVRVAITQVGSGQMQSVPMNEAIQEALRACHFDVSFNVLEWNTLFVNWREGPLAPSARGANATNVSIATIDPFLALARFADPRMKPPVSNNWGSIDDPELARLGAVARTTFNAEARDGALARLHERLVDEAMFVWFVHDVAPRAISPRITGYAAPNGFYVDWSSLDLAAARP